MTIVSKTEPINQIKMLLLSAADDLPQFSKDYQAGLLAVLDVLLTEGIEAEPQRFAQDGLGGEGGLLGEITVFNNRIPPGIVEGLATWLAAKSGRSLRLIMSDREVEVYTKEEIDRFVRAPRGN